MSERPYNVLFLCTGNSARSQIAEALLNVLAKGRMRAFSAGSRPSGFVQPLAKKLIGELGYPVEHLRSKSWDEFSGEGAPLLDFVITVCDNAAGKPVRCGRGIPQSRTGAYRIRRAHRTIRTPSWTPSRRYAAASNSCSPCRWTSSIGSRANNACKTSPLETDP